MGTERYDELARLVNEARAHYQEFADGKKAAAPRARKVLQKIKGLAQEAREEIQTIRKEAPIPGGDAPADP